MRRKHGLDEDLFTILVSAGGFGVGPVEHIIQALLGLSTARSGGGRLRPQRGASRAAGQRRPTAPEDLGGRSSSCSASRTEMDELMTAADLFVGKPGGLTTSEALAKGLPMVVINPIPGQEERNSDHLLEEGIAIRCNNLPALAYKIDRLIASPAS